MVVQTRLNKFKTMYFVTGCVNFSNLVEQTSGEFQTHEKQVVKLNWKKRGAADCTFNFVGLAFLVVLAIVVLHCICHVLAFVLAFV